MMPRPSTRPTPLLAVALVALLVLLPLALASHAQAQQQSTKEVRIEVVHARTEKVYQRLPDGRVVEVYADIYYPKVLVYWYTGKENMLGRVNVTVHCNWTGGWGADVVLAVVPPGFTVDPTTFKPVNYGDRLAEGGCLIGPGSAIAAVPGETHRGPTANCTITLVPTAVYFEQAKKHYGAVVLAKLFLKVRIALYNEKGEIVEGGIINTYTSNETAPDVAVLLAQVATGPEPSKPPSPAAYAATAAMIVLLGYIAYVYVYKYSRRYRRQPTT